MTQKFGRTYRLTIDPADGKPPILITLPFTIQFWLQRSTLSNLNTLSVEVYNLSAQNRARIFQDRFDQRGAYQEGEFKPRKVILEAGYSTLYRVFDGTIYEANSSREGTNIITRIDSRSSVWDIANSQTFQTMQSGQTLGDVLKYLASQFPNLTLGAIGDYPQVMQRPVVLNGNTYELLKTYSAGQVFIDNGKVFVLKDSEILTGKEWVINDATGLLETPRRDDGYLSIKTLLETGVDMACMVKLESTIQKEYNGNYKVISIEHSGMISEARCGVCTSTFGLLANQKFTRFTEVAQAG